MKNLNLSSLIGSLLAIALVVIFFSRTVVVLARQGSSFPLK